MTIQLNMLIKKDKLDSNNSLNCIVKIWGKLPISKGKCTQGVKD